MLQTIVGSSGCINCFTKQMIKISNISCRSNHVNHITVPHKMVEKHRKAVVKAALSKQKNNVKYKGPAIISCKKPQFNHYKGHKYSDFSPQNLASGGWKNSRSNGDYFTINASSPNPALEIHDKEFSHIHSFRHLGIRQEIVDALKEFSITKPTNVQAQATPHILNGYNVLCAAETGSGKTLAFLVPIIQRLLLHNDEMGINKQPNRPFAIIIVPSRELADQIQAVSKDIGGIVGFWSYSQCGGRRTQKLLKERHDRMMDVLVATPGVLSKILTNKIYDLSRLHTIVLDEMDTLMDDSFSALVLRIITKLHTASDTFATVSYAAPDTITPLQLEGGMMDEDSEDEKEMTGLQLVMTGATVPRGLRDIATNVLPLETLIHVKTKSLHRLMPHVSQKFIKIVGIDKFPFLLKHLKQNNSKDMRTIVFCNKSSTVRYLKIVLEENNIETLCLHADSSSQKRETIFEDFQNGKCNVFISTDLASRGLDTIKVNHVINYDFPNFISDYIHRVGRVGRVGSYNAGFVLSFVTKKWDVELLWNIESAARQRTEFSNVNANIKKKITSIARDRLATEENLQLEVP